MRKIRLIARLDVKGPNLIKGIQLEGLRKMGDPNEHAKRYYDQGADEIIYMDIVASLYERTNFYDIVSRTTKEVFVPITAGGGIRSVDDARRMLRAGADKIAINTAAIKDPSLITKISETFGSQCVVMSIEAKKKPGGGWEAYFDNGREHSGLDAVEWAKRGVKLGAGEILLTSVDREGTGKGFDIELVRQVSDSVNVPVIASGGMGNTGHLVDVVREGHADAVAMAHVLHYGKLSIDQVRDAALAEGLGVRACA